MVYTTIRITILAHLKGLTWLWHSLLLCRRRKWFDRIWHTYAFCFRHRSKFRSLRRVRLITIKKHVVKRNKYSTKKKREVFISRATYTAWNPSPLPRLLKPGTTKAHKNSNATRQPIHYPVPLTLYMRWPLRNPITTSSIKAREEEEKESGEQFLCFHSTGLSTDSAWLVDWMTPGEWRLSLKTAGCVSLRAIISQRSPLAKESVSRMRNARSLSRRAESREGTTGQPVFISQVCSGQSGPAAFSTSIQTFFTHAHTHKHKQDAKRNVKQKKKGKKKGCLSSTSHLRALEFSARLRERLISGPLTKVRCSSTRVKGRLLANTNDDAARTHASRMFRCVSLHPKWNPRKEITLSKKQTNKEASRAHLYDAKLK